MKSLVGYTGFVGCNIALSTQFDSMYNSKNISLAYGTKPELLIYAGVRSEMFQANNYPEQDLKEIENAILNIKKIGPKFVVLISTISVLGEQASGYENVVPDKIQISPYGKNRRYLEEWVINNMPHSLVVRLPALYGKGIKKNFIYDYIHIIPKILKREKYEELIRDNHELVKFYIKQDNGFYRCIAKPDDRKMLISYFKSIDFTALSFTDSRSKYQFYPLKYLWEHICRAKEHGIRVLNIATEPMEVSELYSYLEGRPYQNLIMEKPYNYNMRSYYAELYGGHSGYIFDKNFIKNDIREFIISQQKEEKIL